MTACRLSTPRNFPARGGIRVVGGDGGEGPPGPIPNPEAKLPSADGTALDRVWGGKTPPTQYLKGAPSSGPEEGAPSHFCIPLRVHAGGNGRRPDDDHYHPRLMKSVCVGAVRSTAPPRRWRR